MSTISTLPPGAPPQAAPRTLITEIIPGMGMAATDRVNKRNRAVRQAELRKEIRPATALNLSPFVLNVRQGLINYPIPPAPDNKSFAVKTIYTAISYPKFKGNTEMSDKRIKQEWDVSLIMPIEQLLEFKRSYDADLGYEGVSHGGLVVFEGDASVLKDKNAIVNVGSYLQEGLERFLVLSEAKLSDLIEIQLEQLRNKCMGVIQQCSLWWDEGSDAASGGRKNIQRNERIFHDFARRKGWLSADLPWRNTTFSPSETCKVCGQQYVSKTGMCKCGYVREPLIAYKEGVISVEHVRMSTLTADEWKQVNAEETRRKAARG